MFSTGKFDKTRKALSFILMKSSNLVYLNLCIKNFYVFFITIKLNLNLKVKITKFYKTTS